MPLVLPVLLPCTVSSLTFQPSSAVCHKVVRLFWCVEELEKMLPLQVACFKTYLTETSRFSFHHFKIHYDLGATFQIIFHCIHHPFSIALQLTISCSSRRHPSLADADESCLHGALLYFSRLEHSATKKLKSSELKVSKILRPLSSLASFWIRLKSTSTSSGPNSPSNSTTLTFTL